MHYRTDPQQIVKRFDKTTDIKVLVLGDLIVDEYILGEVERISPEAPVPIVKLQHKKLMPGGAANVALNLKKAGVRVSVFGLVGKDSYGYYLKTILQDYGLDVNGIIETDKRSTTVKTRIIAQNQQIVRLDREQTSPIPEHLANILNENLMQRRDSFDGLVIQDYEKGLLTKRTIHTITQKLKGKFIAVDPKHKNFFEYIGVNLFKPNLREVKRVLPVGNNEENLLEVCDYLIGKLHPENLVITLGKGGMILSFKHHCYHIPALEIEVYDVTGAGDTALSSLVIGMLLGLNPVEACILANIASGLVVRKLGTVQVSLDELKKATLKNWERIASGVKKLR